MKKRISLALIVLIILGGMVFAEPMEEEEIFSLEDPRGDAVGPGQYTYPSDPSFPQELPAILDLVIFRAVNSSGATRFEFHFAQPPNHFQPWGGAGYNFHRIDLYISSGGKGSTETFRPGAQVQFKQPWQINLRIRDWQGSYLLYWQDDPEDPEAGIWQGEAEGFNVFVEGNAIVAEINHTILAPAVADWRYYVLIGLQDAYGFDHYRQVGAEGGPWTGGGGSETEFSPNLYDILAADSSQSKQLAWAPGKLAKLEPVGGPRNSMLVRVLTALAIVLAAAGAAALIWLFRK